MNIIQARPGDLDLVVPLFDAYRQFYEQKSDIPGATVFIRERLRGNDSVIFLAMDEAGTAQGFVQLYPSFSSVSMKRLWILNDLFVSPGGRRRGVAEALLKRSADFAMETKSKGLVLETGIANTPAKRLYEKCGWTKEAEFDRYFLNLP